jgi:cysteinyl-tRNA synthetase
MDLKLYDTLSREKRVFKPLDPANVRMYVCGPTVYDFAHIGNARPVIVFDVLFRLLRHIYGADHVTYVRNITDVDDKINARAAEEYPDLPLNEAIRKVTEKTDRQFHDDVAALGCLPPTIEPRATEHIAEMRALIDRLVASNNAYVAEDNVLFSVPSMPDYGRLSKRPLDEMIAGARVEVAPYKRDPQDFVLWKPSKLSDVELTPLWFWAVEMDPVVRPAEPIEPAWPSPCGIAVPGRPGWHIECSAMADKWLWTEVASSLSESGRSHPHQFDIHGGGIDLVFPHHENEIAQSRCAFHTPVMANYWMHNGFLQVEGEKMSKSLGNFFTIHELLEKWPGEVLRLQMLNTHYHQPIDWTEASTQAAQAEIEDWSHRVTDIFGEFIAESDVRLPVSPELIGALSDDVNTPEALSFLRQSAKGIGRDSERAFAFLCDCEFLGLMNRHKLGLLSREFGGDQVTPEVMLQAFDIYHAFRAKMHNRFPDAVKHFREQIENIGADVQELLNGGIRLIPKKTSPSAIEEMIAARAAARDRKDWTESDRIRDELAKMGVVLKDTKDGTTWEIAR